MADWKPFEEFTKELMEREHIAGAAVAVSHNGDIIYSRGFGVRDLNTGEQVTPETIFGVASVSKSFTAMAITQLEDQGKLSVDDPVNEYLPELKFKGIGSEDMKEITIKHLLSHTTGLPPIQRREDIQTFDEHIEFLNSLEPEFLGRPGEYHSYCNDTFLLLGAIIQRLTGRLYRRHMTIELLDAIGMQRSTYTLEILPKLGNVTVPYIYDAKGGFKEVPWPKLGTYEVGGGVRSNVMDLMKYAAVYIRGGMAGNTRLVSQEGLRRMWQPVYQISKKGWYCSALRLTQNYSGVTLVEHSGAQPGVASNFGFVPEEGIAAAVLTNVRGAPASAIWLAAVNTALGLPLEQKRSIETEISLPIEKLYRVVGTYSSQEGHRVTIVIEDDVLYMKEDDELIPLKPSAEDVFFYQESGEQKIIRFYFKDKDGPAWALFLRSRMLRREKIS
jgi:CubicO group peptidase (beta-lactamase class C family)